MLKDMLSKHAALTPDELMQQAAELSRQACVKLAEERKQNRQKAVDANFSRAAIPLRYSNASLDDANETQERFYAVARQYVADFDSNLQKGSGMLVIGHVGTGKTHLVCAIGNDLLKQGRTVLYCTVSEFCQLIKASWKSANEDEFDVFQRFAVPDLLILDEIGVQNGTEWEEVQLTGLFDARSRECKPIIGLSNLSMEDVADVLGERSFDRLIGFGGKVLEMKGRSLRARKLEVVK